VESGRYLLACYRYIELNPVRAGLVQAPGHYSWTSYRHNARGCPDALVTEHEIYQGLGKSPEGRSRAYRALFAQQPDEDELLAIRTSLNEELVFGSERFRDRIEQRCRRRTRRGKPGRPRGTDG
jgi:putative transposase